MKRIKQTYRGILKASLLGLLILAVSCVDNVDHFVPLEIVEKGDVNNVFDQLEGDPEVLASSCESGSILVFSNVVLQIPNGAFVNDDGSPCEGDVRVEVKQVFTHGDLVSYNVPSISQDKLLETDGSFHITAFSGDDELVLDDGKQLTLYLPNDAPVEGMELFYGVIDGVNFYWVDADGDPGSTDNIEVTDWEIFDGSDLITGFGYKFSVEQLGWVGCNQYNDVEPTTEVCVELPEGFTAKNSKIFISFDGINAVASLFPTEDNNIFCTSFVDLPIEYEVTFVVVSEIEGRYYIDKRSAIINPDLNINLTPKATPIAEIQEAIDNL